MDIYERIRYLRKTELKMSQTEFGNRLGVSRDVIKNIELNALAKPEQKLSLYKLICSEFNVSEDWLLNGNGDMYIEPDTFNLDDFVKKHGATPLELEIIKAYFELHPSLRKVLFMHFENQLGSTASTIADIAGIPDTPEELEAQYPPVNGVKKDTG